MEFNKARENIQTTWKELHAEELNSVLNFILNSTVRSGPAIKIKNANVLRHILDMRVNQLNELHIKHVKPYDSELKAIALSKDSNYKNPDAFMLYSIETHDGEKTMTIHALWAEPNMRNNIKTTKAFLEKLSDILRRDTVNTVQWTSAKGDYLTRMYSKISHTEDGKQFIVNAENLLNLFDKLLKKS